MMTYLTTRNFRATFIGMTMALVGLTSTVQADETILDKRLAEAGKRFSLMPGGFEALFTPAFLEKVPTSSLSGVFIQMFNTCGSYADHRITKTTSAMAAEGIFLMTKSYEIPFIISLESAPPHRIEGLFLRAPVKLALSLDSVIADLSNLPGTTSFHAVNLTTGQVLGSYQPDRALPIGSTFKLIVLGTLIEQIASGKRRWTDVDTLRNADRSLPSGKLHTWPIGSPLTMHTLAASMISESDNTATDMLMRIVGRRNIENMQAQLGISAPQRNIPFLTTRELFLLKYFHDGELGHRYGQLDSGGKRGMTEGILLTSSVDSVQFTDRPRLNDHAEWFASTADLTRALDWLRKRAMTLIHAPLLGVMSINHGIDLDKGQWHYVGYKGGSEPGVLNMTLLLQRTDFHWLGVSVSWQHDEPIDTMILASLMTSAVRMLELGAPKR